MKGSFEDYTKPLFLILQILAILFFSIKNANTEKISIIIYPFIIAMPFICIYLNNIYVFVEIFIGQKSLDENVEENKLLAVVCICDFIVTFFYTIIYNNKMRKSFISMKKFIQTEQNFEVKRVKLILFLAAYIFLNTLWIVITRYYLNYFSSLRVLFLIHIGVIRNILLIVFQTVFLAEIKNEFKAINRRITNVNHLNYNKTMQIFVQNEGVLNIIKLADEHRCLSEVVQNFCDVFSFRVLVQIGYFFMMLALGVNPSIRFGASFNRNKVNLEELFNVIVGTMWTFIFLLSVMVLCHFWNSVYIEVRFNFWGVLGCTFIF